jgi:hypothetical protein
MKPLTTSLAILAFVMPCGCSPKPRAAAPQRSAPVTAPAKVMKMVCRDRRNGRSVECGTPNAVMVGMKPA